jgi:hypothetical protein
MDWRSRGKPVIFGVKPNSEAAWSGILPGMILTAVDGRDAGEIIAEKRAALKSSSPNAVKRFVYATLLLFKLHPANENSADLIIKDKLFPE